jgi:(p)ppGpp synthase/HD superfamily hydrolase
MEYSERVVDAMAFMYELHRKQVRKGSEAPYITHLFAVASLVGEYGGDEDQFIAALLHDAVEDQGGLATLERIREKFGPRVAELVWGCSDTDVEPKPPWRKRKEIYIAALAGESPALRLISAADKLHNIRSVVRDLRQHGTEVWTRFKGKRDGSLWYYDAVYAALSNEWEHPILRELAEALALLHSEADAAEGR